MRLNIGGLVLSLFVLLGACQEDVDTALSQGSGTPSSGTSPSPGPVSSPVNITAGNGNQVSDGNGAVDANTVTQLLPACANSNLLICDDFESPGHTNEPNTSLWTVQLTNSSCTATVQNTLVYDGNYALHVHTNNPSGGAGATLHNSAIFPVPNDTLFGRFYAYFDGTLPSTHSSMMKIGGMSGGGEYDWSFGTSVGLLLIDYNAPSTEIYSRANSTLLLTNQWVCIEWEYKGNTQEAHLWINGTEQTDVAVTAAKNWTAPTWDHVYFGWEFYNQDTGDNISAVDVYFDDVAFDGNRIGCSAANRR